MLNLKENCKKFMLIFLTITGLLAVCGVISLYGYLNLNNSSDYSYVAVSVSAKDGNNNSLKSNLYREIYSELSGQKLTSKVTIDTTYDAVIMYGKNRDFKDFTELGVLIGNAALLTIKSKKNTDGLDSNILIYHCFW